MPIGATIGKGTVFEDGAASFMARVAVGSGVNMVQADISSIACEVFDSTGTSVATPAVVVADSVFDTLQTDARWNPDVDTTGYNFRYDMPATTFTTGGRYRVEFMFSPVAGAQDNFPVVFNVSAYALLAS